jgi:hypothetical protein
MSNIKVSQMAEELRKTAGRLDYTKAFNVLDQSIKLAKSSETTLLGTKLGELLGGMESLVEVSDDKAGALLNAFGPVITILTEAAPGIENEIKKLLTSDNETAINSITNNSAVDIHAVVPTAVAVDIHATTVKSSMNHKVISDGSAGAIFAAASEAIEKTDINIFESMLKEVNSDDLKDATKQAVNALQSEEVQNELKNSFADLDVMLAKSTNGLNSGSLLKDVTENFSSIFGNILGNFGSEFTTGNNTNSILNTLLGGSNIGAIDKSASVKTIPPSLSREASENGISTDVKNLNGAQTFINSMSKSISGANFTTLIDEYKAGIDDIITKLGGSKTTVAATINDGNDARHRVRNAETTKADNTFTSLSSQEEITSILSSTNRQFTTVVWHWSGHYNNAANIGAAELDTEYKAIGLKESPYHFVIKKNGIIETGISTENESAHTLEAFRKLSIGVVFIGGYNGEPGGPPGTVNLDVKSLTRAQWDSFYMFMKAFYFERPGGCAYGQNDLIERPNSTDGPGFDVGEKIATYPFNKRNVGNPVLNNKFLTNAEIISELKVSERIINESRDIQ